MVDTMTQTQVSEEEKQDNLRFTELKDKESPTEDETRELGELKERHATRTQKRIDQLTWKARDAEERLGTSSQEVEDLKTEVAELKKQKDTEPVKIVDTTIVVGGKKYYTDDSLASMVKAGDLTDADAFTLQQQRNKIQMKEEILSEIKTEDKKTQDKRVRDEDQAKVLSKYPQFSNKHPDHNPEDPLYKEVTRLWNNGYAYNPKGLSQAITDAKKILRMSDTAPDLSNEFNVNSASAPGKTAEKDVEFTQEEEEASIRVYTMGGAQDNPKTGRPYTIEEAIKKGKEAKKKRLETRRIT